MKTEQRIKLCHPRWSKRPSGHPRYFRISTHTSQHCRSLHKKRKALKLQQQTLSKLHWQDQEEQQHTQPVYYIKVDKSNTVVVLDEEDYENRMKEELGNGF